MSSLVIVLRTIHIASGVYWAGTIFFLVTFLEPSLRSLGPDGGKVMIRFFERGYLTLIPVVATLTLLSGLWLLWLVSSGFESQYMGSAVGIGFSTGGLFAIIAYVVGLTVLRPAGARIWDIARTLPNEPDEAARNALMAEMGRLRERTGLAAKGVFVLLVAAVVLMAIARYL